ncbi:MAG: hypothetical protein OEY11_14195 [Gammaproteobacteria bacterium]|nr:hypothetical protein [Gammaproteobacteria bacterium]
MTEVRLNQYLATVRVRLAEEVLLQHSASSAVVIGNALAEQIDDFVRSQQMGYYPALDYFSQHSALDPDLIDAADSVSWLLCRLVRNEFQSRLRHVFSSLRFQAVQTIAYTMPAVRYGKINALHDLALHYTPLSVKLDIVLSLINKHDLTEGLDEFIQNTLHQCLKDSFESIEVSSVLRLDTP